MYLNIRKDNKRETMNKEKDDNLKRECIIEYK